MKKFICLISLAGVFALYSCDNPRRGIDNDEDADNNLMDQRDTSAINQEFNTRGVPTEGIPDNNAVRDDTIGIASDNSETMRNLPQAVADKIKQDQTLRGKRLTNSREYSEGGTTYYELTFDNEGSTTTFDAQGNKKNP